ncbi:MAG: hypothetical protein Q4C95_11220 [Planctomycetia bacterium]|nr:hypothetical protein [Planctomycetia bacterium]
MKFSQPNISLKSLSSRYKTTKTTRRISGTSAESGHGICGGDGTNAKPYPQSFNDYKTVATQNQELTRKHFLWN